MRQTAAPFACLLALLPLFLSPTPPLVVATSCSDWTTCTSCTEVAFCGFCVVSANGSASFCAEGDAAGPWDQSLCSSPGAQWRFSVANCPADACAQYANCTSCSQADPALNCGWCSDSSQCMTGSASGPFVGSCSAQGWSWESCGTAAECATLDSCASCLTSPLQSCGWCSSSRSCLLGSPDGPYASSAVSCPPDARGLSWRFDDSYTQSKLACYRPSFAHAQRRVSKLDWVVFSLDAGAVLAALLLSLGLLGACGCGSGWVPRPGDAAVHKRSLVDEHDLYNEGSLHSDEHDHGALCCASYNRPACRLLLWILSLAQVGLLAVSLCLDSWSQSRAPNSNLSGGDNPLTVVEGVLNVRVSLGRDGHEPSSFAYDCDESSDAAQLECMGHTGAGWATLGCAALAALCSALVALAATSDLFCPPQPPPPQFSPSPSSSPGALGSVPNVNPAHIRRLRFPFRTWQWRAASLSAVYALVSCALWANGSFLLSRQYLPSLRLGLSFALSAVAGALGAVLALLYRSARRLTPREGYPLPGEVCSDPSYATHPAHADARFYTATGARLPLNSALGLPTASKTTSASLTSPLLTGASSPFHSRTSSPQPYASGARSLGGVVNGVGSSGGGGSLRPSSSIPSSPRVSGWSGELDERSEGFAVPAGFVLVPAASVAQSHGPLQSGASGSVASARSVSFSSRSSLSPSSSSFGLQRSSDSPSSFGSLSARVSLQPPLLDARSSYLYAEDEPGEM